MRAGRSRATNWTAAGLLGAAAAAHCRAPARAATTHELPLFTISKSENKNQVRYSVRVDDDCVALGDSPVFAYWLMNEQGPGHTEPLLPREQPAYGTESQAVTSRSAAGAQVRLVLRAVPSRTVNVETFRAPSGACAAVSTVPIAGGPAHLYDVYVKLGWLGSVDYLLLEGWSIDGTHVVTEKVKR